MVINEDTLAPLRRGFGGERGELHMLEFRKDHREAWVALHQALPKGFWTYSWHAFPDLYHEPSLTPQADLTIAVLLAFTRWVPRLKPRYGWMAIEHQSGGIANQHPRFVARRLTPKAPVHDALLKIARDRWNMDIGAHRGAGHPDDVWQLDRDLGRLGLSCRHVGRLVEESVYPVDVDDEVLRQLVEDPPVLGELIEDFDAEAERSNLALIILAENSD